MKQLRHRPGRLPSLGQDHDEGHRNYVAALGDVTWLQTKPFSSPPTYELGRCLHSFAHIVDALRVGPGARVLDVGCGPGWLSEFLARCGYHVTGVDFSADMIEIAKQRVATANTGRGEAPDLVAEFHAMSVREIPWEGRFEIAVLYDAMHHFDEELETLRVIRRALVPGGRIYIHEGSRPQVGSDGERQLIEEMRRYGTLESPFDPAYLLHVVRDAGFVDVQPLVEVDRLAVPANSLAELRRLWRHLRRPDTNTVIATNPSADGVEGGVATLAATLTVGGVIPPASGGDVTTLRIHATNTGSREWPASGTVPAPRGTVTVAPFTGPASNRSELGRVSIPWTVQPGQSVDIDLPIAMTAIRGASVLCVELVAEGVAWFSEIGTPALAVPVESLR